MNTEKIQYELKEEETQLLVEIVELQQKVNELDPSKMNQQLLDSIKKATIDSIANALGVSDIMESQINSSNLVYNALDMDNEYKSYQKFQKEPGNIGKVYSTKFVPENQFKDLLKLETKTWNRDKVTGDAYQSRINQMKLENPEGFTSAYTGRFLKHGDKYDYEHYISASDAARNPVNKMYLKEEILRDELINAKENIGVIERNINQSKNNTKAEDIDKWMDGKYNQDPSKTREEGYGLDRNKIHENINKAEEKRKQVLVKNGGEKKINIDADITAGKPAAGNSVKAGLKAAFGKLLTITVIEVIEEFKLGNDNDLSIRFKSVIRRIKDKAKDIMNTFVEFSINGFISSILDTILNALLKTAKNLLKFIKTALMSIFRAIKVLFSSDYSLEEKKSEALKILGASIGILIGIALEEIIQTAIVSAFPPLANIAGFISPVLSGLIVGIGSVLVLQGFQRYQNQIEFTTTDANLLYKYDKLITIKASQSTISYIETSQSVLHSLNIFGNIMPMIQSFSNEIDQSLSRIRIQSKEIDEISDNSKILDNEFDSIFNMIKEG